MTTQKDIARRLGVSVSLVSRALSGKAQAIGVPVETVTRIRNAAKELGYVPNATARTLQGARAMVIGGVMCDVEDPFFGPVVGGLQRLAQASGYAMMLTGLDVEPLLRYRLDGVVIVGSGELGSLLDPMLQRGIPVVRIGSGAMPESCGQIQVDHQAGVCSLLQHLVGNGRRRIGFIGGRAPAHQARFDLFKAHCTTYGAETRPDWWGISEHHVSQAGPDAARRLLARSGGSLPDAVLASSDAIAVGAYPVFAEAGVVLGSGLAIAGYDGLPLGEIVTPALTTVRQPIDRMVTAAFDWLCRAMDTPVGQAVPVVFSPELILRDSSGSVRHQP